MMYKLLKSKHLNKYFLMRLLPVLFIAIFLSVGYYTYFIFNDTLNAIEDSKIKEVEEVAKQISNGLDLSLKKHQLVVDDLLVQPGLRVAMDLYNDISQNRQESYKKFLDRKYGMLKEQLPYLKGYNCITKDGNYINGNYGYTLDFNKFIKSKEFASLTKGNDNNIWVVNRDANWLTDVDYNDISIIHKVYDKSGRNLAGYFILTIDVKIMETFYYKSSIGTSLHVVILDDYNNPIFTTHKTYCELGVGRILKTVHVKDLSKGYILDIGKYIVNIKAIDSNGWKVLVYANKDLLTASLRSSITSHLLSIILYSLLISLVIFLESYILMKVVTDKQIVNYKLQLTDNMNDKLRMYKHDFMNHLQIINGLIELEFYDKAGEYIVNTANEGISINKYGDIGIPEIESIVYSAIAKAIDKGYEVKYDFVKVEDNLEIDMYDLSRILLNLTKNALHALDSSSEPSKTLEINITEELGCLVFKISNSTPLIPEEIRKNIFEKGYTTKGAEGKGLGLHIVKQLVQKNGGLLSLKVDERGNHFTVSFPTK